MHSISITDRVLLFMRYGAPFLLDIDTKHERAAHHFIYYFSAERLVKYML